MYKLKDIYADKDILVTTIDGEVVNIAGKVLKKVVAATKRTPQREVTIRAATQKDLEKVYNRGSKFIEKVDVKADKAEKG